MRILLTLLLVNSAYAFETCCVDEDIAAAFLSYMTLSRDWPADFPLKVDFDGFEFIGSSTFTEAKQDTVAWKTELPPKSAVEVVTETILKDGWVPLADVARMRSLHSRGFIPHQTNSAEDGQQYCRGKDGTLSVRARQATIGTVVALTHNYQTGGRDCAGLIAERSVTQGPNTGIMNYLPTLTLPPSIDVNHGSGMGGGGNEAEATLSVTTGATATDASIHFEPQMKAQQWVLETHIQSGRVNGHVWQRSADGLDLICIITAIENTDGLVLRMHVQSL